MDLHAAANAGQVLVVRTLVEQGADVHAQDARGRRPLHRAARGGHVEVAQALVEFGADINARSADGVRPLHYATNGGHVEVLRAWQSLERTSTHGRVMECGRCTWRHLEGMWRRRGRC